MSNNLKIATLEDYEKSLSQQDAILEQNIYSDVLSEYLKLGGAPMNAVNLLSESYCGIPSMCNVTAQAVDSIGLNSDAILRQAIRQQLKDRFDPNLCYQVFMQHDTEMAPEWLDVLIEDTHWRQTIYELFEKHPGSVFLNFAILRIAEAGHEDEVSKLRTASTYIQVYNLILEDAIYNVSIKDDLEFQEDLPALVRVCCERGDTYLYVQILLGRLREKYNATPLRRLSKELEYAARRTGNPAMVDMIHNLTSDAPLELSKTISSILNSSSIMPGDLNNLKRAYNAEKAPPVTYLCDYDLIIKMLKALYVPNNGSLIKPDMVDDVTYLIAYATTFNDSKTKDEQHNELRKIQVVLKDLYTSLSTKTEVGGITGAMKYIISAIRFPVGSMGVLLWIEYMALHTTHLETYYLTSETPILLLILDEIASRHQLQQVIVFDVIKKCVQHKPNALAPEIQLSLQRTWVDRMLYLVQLHYTIPVLQYFTGEGRKLDDSLIVHFVKKVLRMAKAPYSTLFIQHMVDIVEPLVEKISLVKDIQQPIMLFLDQALDGGDLSDKLQLRIKYIMKHCK